MNKVLGNKKAISLFVVPALVIYTIIVMVPVIWSLYYSFFSGARDFSGSLQVLTIMQDFLETRTS